MCLAPRISVLGFPVFVFKALPFKRHSYYILYVFASRLINFYAFVHKFAVSAIFM